MPDERGLATAGRAPGAAGLHPTYRGDPYGQGLDWLYFDCFFEATAGRRHFGLGAETRYVAYDGRAAGQEAGFYDPRTGFGLLGHHPAYGRANGQPEITSGEGRVTWAPS